MELGIEFVWVLRAIIHDRPLDGRTDFDCGVTTVTLIHFSAHRRGELHESLRLTLQGLLLLSHGLRQRIRARRRLADLVSIARRSHVGFAISAIPLRRSRPWLVPRRRLNSSLRLRNRRSVWNRRRLALLISTPAGPLIRISTSPEPLIITLGIIPRPCYPLGSS